MAYETFNGNTWENPYLDEWRKLYEGVKYCDDLHVDVKIENVEFESAEDIATSSAETSEIVEKDDNTVEDNSISEEKLMSLIGEQEVRVISTKYIVQDENYKTLYPDVLQAVLANNTAFDIKNAVVAFVAWDNNNLPVKIKGSIDFSDGAYIRKVNYSDINMVPNSTFGDKSGFEIAEECGIKTFI